MHTTTYVYKIISWITDSIFPKDPDVQKLEQLSPTALKEMLPPTRVQDTDIDSLFSYKDPLVRKLVWEIKYKNNTILCTKVAHCMYTRARHKMPRGTYCIAVPQHKTRTRIKGFNQSIELVKAFQKIDTEKYFKYDYRLITKVRKTALQNKVKNKDERLKNLAAAFTCTRKVPNKSFLLIDDVYTTGATASEIKKCLGRPMHIYTIAH